MRCNQMSCGKRRMLAVLAITSVLLAASLATPASAATFVAPTWTKQIGGPGRAFVYPWGIATAIDGTILVGDYVNGNIKRFDTSGTFLGQFGSLGGGNGQFQQPNSVAVDPSDGSIYVS